MDLNNQQGIIERLIYLVEGDETLGPRYWEARAILEVARQLAIANDAALSKIQQEAIWARSKAAEHVYKVGSDDRQD